jgi:hypothetical protein
MLNGFVTRLRLKSRIYFVNDTPSDELRGRVNWKTATVSKVVFVQQPSFAVSVEPAGENIPPVMTESPKGGAAQNVTPGDE